MTPRRTRSILRTLIGRCENDIVVQRRAALDLSRPIHRARLNATVRQRETMVAELEKALRDLGSAPSWFGPSYMTVITFAWRCQRWLCGQHDGDTFARCSEMAERTSGAYESALGKEIGAELSKVLQRHYDSVAKTCIDFSHARGAC